LGGYGVEEVEEFLIVLVLKVFLIEHHLGDALEEAGHENAGAFLGLLAEAAVAPGDLDECVAGFRDLDERLEEPDLPPRVTAVLEGVEVALGGAGAGTAAAPSPPLFSH